MVVQKFLTRLFLLYCLMLPAILQAANEITIRHIVADKGIETEELVLWQRQLLTIEVSITTEEEFAYFKQLDISRDGFKIESIIHSKKSPAENKFIKQLYIFIWPQNPGKHTLKLGSANLFLSGRSIKQITIPELTFLTRPLPSYIPPGIPVGIINLSVSYKSTDIFPYFFINDQISSAIYQLESKGIAENFLPDYHRSLNSDSITVLQSRKIKTTADNDTENSLTQEYETPFVTKSNGIIDINELKVVYFDPYQSKLVSYKTGSKRLLSFHWLIRSIIIVLFVIIVFWLLIKLRLLTLFVLHRRDLWKDILLSNEATTLASSLARLRPLSINCLKDIDHKAPVDLSDWAGNWQIEKLTIAIAQLNYLNYAPTTENTLDSIKNEIIQQLKHYEYPIFYLGVKNNLD